MVALLKSISELKSRTGPRREKSPLRLRASAMANNIALGYTSRKKIISQRDIESRAAYYQPTAESITLESLKIADPLIGWPAIISQHDKIAGFLKAVPSILLKNKGGKFLTHAKQKRRSRQAAG
jgi:hypothetical protein